MARFARTVSHLRPVQPLHRVRLRGQRSLIRVSPDLARRLLTVRTRPVAAWSPEYAPLDARLSWPSADAVKDGRLTLLGHEEVLGFPFDWRPDVPQLWSFHLHYWDWAWGLVDAPDVYRSLMADWIEKNPLGSPGDGWSPYVASLRAWSWAGQRSRLGPEIADLVDPELGLLAGFVRRHLELDLGGNHLIKNIKALVGLGQLLGDSKLLRHGLGRLRSQLGVQVLADGGHFERAPAYHCQVLADLMDIAGLLGHAAPEELLDAIQRMRRFLGLVLLPDGSVPLLNDGFPVDRGLLAALEPGPPAPEGITVLEATGMAVLRRGGAHVLADVGAPCPEDLPGHAHADTLGFLLHVGRERLVGEVGTSTYEAGPTREMERSTAAHSTVVVDNENSTEVWGAFRAGRRALCHITRASDEGGVLTLTAAHNGYRHLTGRPVHRRTWQMTAERLVVIDEVLGSGRHQVDVILHEAQCTMLGQGAEAFRAEPGRRALGWSRGQPSTVLRHSAVATLPWRIEYSVKLEQQ